MPQHRLIYLFDALCGWCYGFSPVLQRVHEQYKDTLQFEVLSGGMMMGARVGSINEVAPFIKTAYKQVEETTGTKFGEAYIEHILKPGTTILSSELPGIALTVFRHYQPERVFEFAHALQKMHYFDGVDLNLPENYRSLAEQFGIPADEYVEALTKEENRYETMQEFQTVANWGIGGFPTVLLKPAHDEQYFMIARGYTPFERLEEVIGKVLAGE